MVHRILPGTGHEVPRAARVIAPELPAQPRAAAGPRARPRSRSATAAGDHPLGSAGQPGAGSRGPARPAACATSHSRAATGPRGGRMRPAGWVPRIPSVPVVLNYCGLPWQRDENSLDVWRSGMRALAASPNVACKVSELGLADRAWSEADSLGTIRETIEIFGPSRALFASNFPVA